MNDDNVQADGADAPKPWWAYRAAGESAFAGVSARRAREAQAARRIASDPEAAPAGDTAEPDDEPRLRTAAARKSGLAAGIVAGVALALLMVDAQARVAPVLGRALLPIFGVAAAAAVGPALARRHADEPWLPGLLVWAMVFKLFATFLRYQVFQGKGDAVLYDKYGRQVVEGVAKVLPDRQKTNFIKWFTGVVYLRFGADIIVGFFVFGLIAFVGSYLWYRATVTGVPFIDKRLYFILVFFAPSVAFWPSAIGKEAIMEFAMGLAALGTAMVLTGKFLPGFIVAAPGGYLLWLVRPHLLAFFPLAPGAGAGPRGPPPRPAPSGGVGVLARARKSIAGFAGVCAAPVGGPAWPK